MPRKDESNAGLEDAVRTGIWPIVERTPSPWSGGPMLKTHEVRALPSPKPYAKCHAKLCNMC